MSRRKIVIAGSYDEFRRWQMENDISPLDAMYADSNEKIMGLELSPSDIVYVGNYHESKVDQVILRSRIRLP